MIRRVLVPLDGSRMAEAALGHAAAIVTALGAGLVLLRVVEGRAALTDPAAASVDWRLRRVEAEAYLRQVAARLSEEGVEAATEVVEGKAADEIVQFVRGRAVDLVVLAAHGRGAAREFPFGGTVHKVLASAPASVMVIRPPSEGAPSTARVVYRRILVPVDGSPASEWALCLAASVARGHGAELLILQVVPDPELTCERLPRSAEETELLGRLQELQRERGLRYLREMEAKLAQEDLPVRCRVVGAAQIAEGVQEVAVEEGADLVALSAHGTAEAAFPYGKVAQRLLARSPVPVLVFQDLPAAVRGGLPAAKASAR
ncbi:MAG TPA: universal stress protein [Thermoanaerobaculia bacterium]